VSTIIKQTEIEGHAASALFDTGAMASCVRRELLADVPKRRLPESYRVGLGGRTLEVREACVALARIDGMSLDIEVVPVDALGHADGHTPDALIGALAMEKWEIKLDPRNGALDLEGLRRRELTEF
jgi:hypothetical protein